MFDILNLLKKQKTIFTKKQTYFDETILKHEHPDWGYGENDLVLKLNLKNEDQNNSIFG